MAFVKALSLTVITVLLIACGSEPKDASELFDLKISATKKVYKPSQTISIEIVNKQQLEIESSRLTLDGKELVANASNFVLSLQDQKMGQRALQLEVVVDGITYNLSKEITVVAEKAPKLYTYKVVESYPHDVEAYTQGLEFKNDTLYESTGQRGKSSLRKTDYRTGEVLELKKLGDQYFGEGLTILKNKIYQLTWQSNTGFIYDLNTLENKGSFVYSKSKEGWGLCNDGQTIYKSDGTEKIWTLDGETLAEQDFIQIYTHTSVIDNVNELEWVDGKIYANVYQEGAIAIVNPETGAVEGVINLRGLKDMVTQHETLDVLNGIAYKNEPNHLYVTGKNWDKLFKIEIIEK